MRGLIGVLAAVACLAAAGSAAAAVTFGPDLTIGDAGQGTACSSYTYPSGPAPSSCVAALVLGDSYAPVKGIITSFSIRMATPVMGRLRTAHISDNSQPFITDMTMLKTGGDVSVPGDSAVHSFPVRLPIAKGDVIAFASTVAIYRNNQGRSYARRVSRDSPDGSTAEMPTMGAGEVSSEEVPINATIEGDADGDGYGDETQDMCPTIASTHDACPGTVPPPPRRSTPPGPPPPPPTPAPARCRRRRPRRRHRRLTVARRTRRRRPTR